jgi:branched-chain amino acid transport system ATP-binding protein
MLRLALLSVRIGGADVLHGVTLHVPPNSFVALVGRNGAGKTTLMRSVMNLLPIASGDVHIAGRNTTRMPPHAHARNGVGYMPEGRRLVADWTVEQNIMLPAWASHRRDARSRLEWIYALVPEVGRVADHKTTQLSGGQQKLVAMARAFMAGSDLLPLDEPFEGVAPALARRLAEILSGLRQERALSVLVCESDAVHSQDLVDRIYTIERGRIVGTSVPAASP